MNADRDDGGLLGRIRARGEEVLTQLSAELMSNPRVVRAVEGAAQARDKLEHAAAKALRQMNVPSQAELRRANSRIEVLEREVAALRRQAGRAAGASSSGRRSSAPKAGGARKRGKARGGRRPRAAGSAE